MKAQTRPIMQAYELGFMASFTPTVFIKHQKAGLELTVLSAFPSKSLSGLLDETPSPDLRNSNTSNNIVSHIIDWMTDD
jgi:hypothetical protein